MGRHLLGGDVEYAPRFGFASSKTGLLDHTGVRVVLVAVVAILVFLFVGHLCRGEKYSRYNRVPSGE